MKNCTLLLTVMLMCLGQGTLLAQDEEEQQVDKKSLVTPPSMWEISPNFGYMFVAGDVKSKFGWGAGLSARKATDYLFSLRFDLLYGQTAGDNEGEKNFPERKFDMNWFSGTAFAVFSLNSLRFDKPVRKTNLYVMPGVGLNSFNVDYTDETSRQDRKIDGEIAPHVTLGGGISFRASPRFNIGLEYQAFMVFGSRADRVDGINTTGNFRDVLNYANLRLNFNIGNADKRSEPLYWVNPLQVVLDDINALEENQLTLEDGDDDGVIDQLDQELNSAPGALVDTKGRTLDSDRDGVPDHLDKEPYYTPREGERVNEEGVVVNPIVVGGGGVTEERVRELIDEALQNYQPASGGSDITDLFLPMIHFGINSTQIKYSDYGTLASIARVMKDNPSVRLVIRGYTDQTGSETYNEALSYDRANAVIEHLETNHGIGRGRMLLQYGGQGDALVPTTSSYMNRRVEFSVARQEEVEMDPPANYNENKKSGGY